MKKYKKLLIGTVLLILIFGFVGVKEVQAITIEERNRIIEEIRTQIVTMLAKLAEIQRQLNELIEREKASAIKLIVLTAPNGGEKWEVGRTYDIKWNSSGYPSDSKVKIELIDERYDQNSLAYELNITETNNSGVYSWKVPDLLQGFSLYGSLYKIAVSIEKEGEEKSDTTDNYFIIAQAIPSYLNIIFPNGGEVLQVGKTYTIKWDSLGMETYKVSIILKKSDIIHLIIAENIPNNSFYNWKVSQGLFGSDYKMLINIYDNNGNLMAWDSSNYNFTIIQ